ncbi:hypothetical protein O9929_06080 [Vibrio lentus]|nr:hypothetical protein [Vibrio lentus]
MNKARYPALTWSPDVAVNSFNLYAARFCEANLLPPPEPKTRMARPMEVLSFKSL